MGQIGEKVENGENIWKCTVCGKNNGGRKIMRTLIELVMIIYWSDFTILSPYPEHIPIFRALLKTTNPHQKADSVHVKMQTRSTLKKHARGGI